MLMLANEEVAILIPVLAVIIFGCGWMLKIILRGAHDIKATREREESRREIAAYIAEGSMTPEQGERLMQAGGKSDQKA